jgi:hypothetical protein
MLPIRAVKAVAVAVSVAGALFAAAPRASADAVPVSPYALVYPDANGVLMGFESDYGVLNVNAALAPGTSPSAGPIPGDYMFVWHGANNDLWTTGLHGPIDTGVTMAPGTSPSLVTFPNGDWFAAVQRPNGILQAYGQQGGVTTGADTGLAMAPGTSPSVAATPINNGPLGPPVTDHFTFAFQGTNGDLWTDTFPLCPPTRCHPNPPEGPADTGDRMAPGTSPSVTRANDNPDAGGVGATGNYVAAYQGTDGHLWVQHCGQAAIESPSTPNNSNSMAPGASPSIRTLPVGVDAYYPIGFRGSNGDLLFTYERNGDWIVPNEPGGEDTGSPMMAGTNPSVMVSPVDEPGLPLGGSSAYSGYVSSTGVVSVFGYNYYDNTTFNLSTDQTAAGTPSLVSALNWVDHGTVVSTAAGYAHGAPHAAVPATADVTTVPLGLPSRPVVKPTLAPPAISSTCPAVRASLRQYAARGIKKVACETTTLGAPAALTPPAPPRTGSQAVKPRAAASLLCTKDNAWTSSRTEECIQNGTSIWTIFLVPSGQQVGTATFLISQDITLQTNSTLPVENDSITWQGNSSPQVPTSATIKYTTGCNSPCELIDGGGTTYASTVGQTQSNIRSVYEDLPGTVTPDTFNTDYSFNPTFPGVTGPPNPETWSPPQGFRCDNIYPGTFGPGCVVPGYVPTLVLHTSVYADAAVNAFVGEKYLPGTPGLSAQTPLTRGDPNDTDSNRNVICGGFKTKAQVPNDSCDEYPFAASQQSGGLSPNNVTGANCLETQFKQLTDGRWSFQFLNQYINKYPQICERGHVNNTQNQAVGTALITMYTVNRMLIGDAYTVQVIFD